MIFDVKFLQLDCERCENILQIIEKRTDNRKDTIYSEIQKELFGTKNHSGHHHSLDRCLKDLKKRHLIKISNKSFFEEDKMDRRKVFYELEGCIVIVALIQGVLSSGWLTVWSLFEMEISFSCVETFLLKNNFKCKQCGAEGQFRIDSVAEDISIGTIDYDKIAYDCERCGFAFSYNYYY